MISLFHPYIRRGEICKRLLIIFVRIDQSNIFGGFTKLWKNSLLLSKYWLKYTKLVGFTRFISYTSFYVFFISFICILLSPSPKTSVVPTRLTQRSGAESHDNEGPKQIRCNYLFQIISSIPTKLTTVWRVCFKIMSLIYQCFLTCV